MTRQLQHLSGGIFFIPGTENGGFQKPHWAPSQDSRTPEQKSRDERLGRALGREWSGHQPPSNTEEN